MCPQHQRRNSHSRLSPPTSSMSVHTSSSHQRKARLIPARLSEHSQGNTKHPPAPVTRALHALPPCPLLLRPSPTATPLPQPAPSPLRSHCKPQSGCCHRTPLPLRCCSGPSPSPPHIPQATRQQGCIVSKGAPYHPACSTCTRCSSSPLLHPLISPPRSLSQPSLHSCTTRAHTHPLSASPVTSK